MPESAFEMLVRRQIKKLEQPAVQCVQQALHELVSIVDFPLVNISEFSHHLKLKEAVKAISRQVIDEHLASTLKAVTDFIQVELAFINKSHPDFMSGKRAIAGFLSAAGERGLHVEKNHVDNVREKAIQSGGGNTPTTKLSDSDEAVSVQPNRKRFHLRQKIVHHFAYVRSCPLVRALEIAPLRIPTMVYTRWSAAAPEPGWLGSDESAAAGLSELLAKTSSTTNASSLELQSPSWSENCDAIGSAHSGTFQPSQRRFGIQRRARIGAGEGINHFLL